jgi:5-methylcytosine-specific restriction endonuclease McrA
MKRSSAERRAYQFGKLGAASEGRVLFTAGKPPRSKQKRQPMSVKARGWRKLRAQVIKTYGSACLKCGAIPKTVTDIQIDHIYPRRKYPARAYRFDNLQVLCGPCNQDKGTQIADYRPKP